MEPNFSANYSYSHVVQALHVTEEGINIIFFCVNRLSNMTSL